jgi:hypothetical protein
MCHTRRHTASLPMLSTGAPLLTDLANALLPAGWQAVGFGKYHSTSSKSSNHRTLYYGIAGAVVVVAIVGGVIACVVSASNRRRRERQQQQQQFGDVQYVRM